ncbi:TPA: hypothetical protein ACJJ1B_004361 [Enterobacter roggenkampii]|uniref:dCTP deaminase domain-containing protein n=1 Tax=Enterobacter roggenkampii TaxID=1812935 RepID=UPI000B3B4698|nr:hypothetical protein [Enterobacter roggenkampii]OUR39136.1 hypothetical protein B9J96_02890 [Enterobacter roggenkampii]
MLNQSSFLKKCENNNCCFFKNFNTLTKTVNIKNLDNIKSDLNDLKNSITKKGARFPLTLGPVVKRYNKKVSKKEQFKGKPYLQDLRNGDNSLLLEPHETVSILSNEYVETDNETGALIFPRLSLADVGVALIPTYVDPFWKGILQMTLVNNTKKTIKIKLGESIGVIFFNEIDEALDDDYQNAFPTTSHHFGQTWEKIIDQDAEPFLNKKTHADINLREHIKLTLQEYKDAIFKVISFATFVSVIFTAGYGYNQVLELKKSVDEFKEEKHTPYTGITQLTINKGEKNISKTIDINIKAGLNPVVLTKSINKMNNDDIHATIAEAKGNVVTKISLTLNLDKKSTDTKVIDVQWILIP